MPGDLLNPWELAGLKSVTRHAIQRIGGGKVAELVAGRVASVLHGYGDPNLPAWAPIDVALRLDRQLIASGLDPMIVPLLASHLGLATVRAPASAEPIQPRAAALLRESAEMAAGYIEATLDGAICDRDRAQLVAAADRLIDLAMRLRAALDAAPAAEG